ncbi:MAG: hypothetical protein V1818_01790 [Candidatus Aenigmatarchaeota archaeon]
MISKGVILGIFMVALMVAIIYSLAAYAMKNDSQYNSYTKTIKSCDGHGNCMLRDLLVQCLGDSVIDITLIGESPDVPESFEGGNMFSWCN